MNRICVKQEAWMKALIATIFIAGASFAGVGSVQAMSVAPLAEQAGAETMIVQVRKACTRGYILTPHGCRKKTSR
jgi:hypothetical protein